MNISQIAVLDWYGGPHYVDVKDYYKVTLDEEESSSELQNQEDNEIPMYYLPEDTDDSDEVVGKIDAFNFNKTVNINTNFF